jgi:hypothetical protein
LFRHGKLFEQGETRLDNFLDLNRLILNLRILKIIKQIVLSPVEKNKKTKLYWRGLLREQRGNILTRRGEIDENASESYQESSDYRSLEEGEKEKVEVMIRNQDSSEFESNSVWKTL